MSPVLKKISCTIPSTGEGTSKTTLSVSRSTIFSSRCTMSPTFLCHVAIVASTTDSGKTGTLISIDLFAILYDPLIIIVMLAILKLVVVWRVILDSPQQVPQQIPCRNGLFLDLAVNNFQYDAWLQTMPLDFAALLGTKLFF